MVRRFIKWPVLVFAVVFLLAGCAGTVRKEDFADKVYTYEKDGCGGDFTVTINSDGTFSYYEGFLSSYIGAGEWTLEGDTLVLTDDMLVNRFQVDGNDIVFLAEGSDNFIYVKAADGERFLGSPAEQKETQVQQGG